LGLDKTLIFLYNGCMMTNNNKEKLSEFIATMITPTMARMLKQAAEGQMLSISAYVRQVIARDLGLMPGNSTLLEIQALNMKPMPNPRRSQHEANKTLAYHKTIPTCLWQIYPSWLHRTSHACISDRSRSIMWSLPEMWRPTESAFMSLCSARTGT